MECCRLISDTNEADTTVGTGLKEARAAPAELRRNIACLMSAIKSTANIAAVSTGDSVVTHEKVVI